jgi:hypothetical protein
MGKGGGKKGKGPVCPEHMTPEYFQQSNVRQDHATTRHTRKLAADFEAVTAFATPHASVHFFHQ